MMDDASSSLLLSFDRKKGVCRGTTLSEKEYIKNILLNHPYSLLLHYCQQAALLTENKEAKNRERTT